MRTTKQLGDKLNISTEAARRLVLKSAAIRPVLIGGRWLLTDNDFQTLVDYHSGVSITELSKLSGKSRTWVYERITALGIKPLGKPWRISQADAERIINHG